MKKINIKQLTFALFTSLLVSLLYVYVMTIGYGCFHGNADFDVLWLLGFLFFLILSGYLEVLVIYAVFIFFIKTISNVAIKRIVYFFLWMIVFSCVEIWFIFLFSHAVSPFEISEHIIYLPPFLIKLLFFVYYKFKEKQDCLNANVIL